MKRLRPLVVRMSVFTALVLASGVGGGWKWERLLG
jgi:hypothetical protein